MFPFVMGSFIFMQLYKGGYLRQHYSGLEAHATVYFVFFGLVLLIAFLYAVLFAGILLDVLFRIIGNSLYWTYKYMHWISVKLSSKEH